MKVTADSNVLVRALVQDDPEQAKAAADLLERAELVDRDPRAGAVRTGVGAASGVWLRG